MLLMFSAVGFAQTTYSKIEQMSGWQWCSTCANGKGTATISMTQNQFSPSLDGNSTKFAITGGSVGFSHGLWWKRLGNGTATTHAVLDLYNYLKNPSASWGLEYNANQTVNYRRYQWSTQCSYGMGIWRVWDTYNGHWVDTSVPCKRPAAYTWQHIVWEFARSSGKAVFVSVTVNGQKYYVNKSFSSKSSSTANSLGVHFQLNGNQDETPYAAWVDKLTLKVW